MDEVSNGLANREWRCLPVEEAFRNDPQFPQFWDEAYRRARATAAGWTEYPPERPGVSTYWLHEDSDTIVFQWTPEPLGHAGLIDRRHCGCYDCRKLTTHG